MTIKSRLYLDLALFGALLLAYNPAWTGLAVHEWLCVAAIVPLLFHVIINWDQTLQILRRFAAIVRAMPKVNLVVDAGLFVAAVTVTVSGFMVSQAVAGALGISITPTALWIRVHSIGADATIALLLVHFVLHWRWIVNAARRLGRPSAAAQRAADPLTPVRLATRRLATVPVTSNHPAPRR